MTAALDQISQRKPATTADISQATAVEQSRAIAEVQAAVYVAQANPRSLERAVTEMREACSRMALASVAFYTVPNRGHDKSVHLARELIRIWGNTDYGVRELRRDDEAGESEVLAYAWDQQANTRSSRSFINPHAKMVSKKRVDLTDLQDIYLSNQNIGARAVRECIFTVLPRWFAEEAADLCKATLANGKDGESVADRITKMVAAFAQQHVDVKRLEAKVGKPRDRWTGQDLADAAIWYTSITRDGVKAEDLFPEQIVTGAEIQGRPAAASAQSPTDTFVEEPPADWEPAR